MMTDESFEIRLPQFEGPFDLLLFFIERDELDIHDIPIARITDDFLHYLHQMASLDMEAASEFIFVAATLMRIKAKLLLPGYEAGGGADETDHKEDMVRKLVEYKKFKEICAALRPYEEERMKQEKRGNIAYNLEQVDKTPLPGQEVTLYKLMMVFERLTKNYEQRSKQVTHTIEQYPYTIEKQKAAINRLLKLNKLMDFKTFAANSDNKVHFVYNFLAMLEMLQQELVNIQVGLGYNHFFVSLKEH